MTGGFIFDSTGMNRLVTMLGFWEITTTIIDGSDTTCCARCNILRNLEQGNKPPLLERPMQYHGRKVLRENQLPPGQAREKNGAVYVGDRFVSVVMEGSFSC